jgi:predicted enzyme related to lactoylglutathione lyase
MAGVSHEDAAASFDPLRPKLMRVAYRMLGSVADAEDVDRAGGNSNLANTTSSNVRPVGSKNGGTTMLKKVVYMALFVSDQDKALDFYTNVIGLENRIDYPTPDGPRFLTVGVKGQDFEIVLWPGTPGRAKPGSTACTIEVEDCRKAFETLKSRGVKFESSDILEFPWGYAARFQDPDGNLLQVREGRAAFRR